MKIIVVGGVAGGATAIARLRRLSEENELILIEKDEYISYANCGLPYYIGDVITDKQKLQVQTVAGMGKRFNLDIRVKNEVTAIDKENKSVTVKNLATGEIYRETFDKLILSCGAKPIRPNITGLSESDNVFVLRNIPDTYKIKEYIEANKVGKAVVVGGGFIGVEMAENLRNLGIQTTLVEKLPQVLRTLDYEMAQLVHQELAAHGVNLVLGDGIAAFADKGKTVVTEKNVKIPTDMTILAIGISPENALAKNAGFKLGARGHVVTTENYAVIDAATGKANNDIFAIGDMIEVTDPLDGGGYSVPLAWGANRQGRTVADYIGGRKIRKGVIAGSSVLKVFGLTVASTGANETTLQQKGIKYIAIHAHRPNHAGYYPDSSNIALKLIYEPDSGKIFGAQAVGREGTEKRIDVLATAMKLGGTAFDLSELELCYAPPYSSAKDPVNILGYMAEDIADGVYKMVHHDQIDGIVAGGGLLMDVRTPLEYENGHVEGSVNLEVDELRGNTDKLPKDKNIPIFVTCQVGQRAYYAIRILRGLGYENVYNLSGGYSTYKAFKYVPAPIKTDGDKGVNMENNGKSGIKEIDVSGIQCPGPLMATYKAVNEIGEGDRVKVIATDGGFVSDIENWCKTNGHTLVEINAENGKYAATIQKGGALKTVETGGGCDQKNATIVVFSGNFDKVLASMIIAQGAAAQGKNVTMFFTFWGLNALRSNNKVKVKKTAVEKMFGGMMPRGADKLHLSNMDMGGMGRAMIKSIMKKKHVSSLPEMIENAKAVGVKMIACTMSMELMGIKKEELIDGIEYAGVATYISRNENVGTTLFI